MAKFRKNPVVVEAVQWTGLNIHEVTKFCRSLVMANADGSGETHIGFVGRSRVNPEQNKVIIKTLEGMMTANAGDWIIKGVNGEFYLCKPDIFEKTYEPAE